MGPDGYVVVDKPSGWTSHDVVARCRRLIGTRRIGHAGTLDPSATGVLVVGVGRATRLLRYVTVTTKSYVGEIVLGTGTTTLDAEGEVTSRADMGDVDLDDVRRAALGLTGHIEQLPPMVSAVKHEGRRLYDLARQGKEVDRTPRTVEISRFEITPTLEEGVYRAAVDCSSGTYVRVLAADLGERLGGVAHLRALRRTAVGPFLESDALPLENLSAESVLAPAGLVRHLGSAVLSGAQVEDVSHGKLLERAALGVVGPGPWALLDAGGALVAVAEPRGLERVHPAVVLRSAG